MKFLIICILTLSCWYMSVTPLHDGLDGKTINDVKGKIVKTIVVGHRGPADFRSVKAAINSIPSGNKNWIKIYLKHGIYNEKIIIPKEKQKIFMYGKTASKVIIQYNDAGVSATCGPFRLEAEYFIAVGITFKNNYNMNSSMVPYTSIKVAPAAILLADKAWFRGCGFISIQDTLADFNGRHYFQGCYIKGAIDFIWGNGQSIYEKCEIYVYGVRTRKGMIAGYITAQGRESSKETNGFVFSRCVIRGSGKAFLGRAYRAYARVLFHRTYMFDVIVPQGWDSWGYKGHEDKFTFAEVNCIGKGANKKGRVGWEKNISVKDVYFLRNPKTFLDQDGWMATLPPF